MATIERKKNGFWLAKWVAGDGSRQSSMTGYRDFEGALKEANRLEATARFWEAANEGIFSFMAELGFSPDYAHANFSHKGHLPISDFRKLLREAQIEFKKPSQWRDAKNPARKKYRFRNRNVTIDEALMETGLDITVAAVRSRLKSGWSFEEAVTRPVREKVT
jgi:hypothetical protein